MANQTPAANSRDYDLLTAIALAIESNPNEYTRREATKAFVSLIERLQQRQSALALIQQSFGQLRLDMKYLIFDLEATRRERDELRARLGE